MGLFMLKRIKIFLSSVLFIGLLAAMLAGCNDAAVPVDIAVERYLRRMWVVDSREGESYAHTVERTASNESGYTAALESLNITSDSMVAVKHRAIPEKIMGFWINN